MHLSYVPEGMVARIGVSQEPIHPGWKTLLADLAEGISGVVEAHLPVIGCGAGEATLSLVLVGPDGDGIRAALGHLDGTLAKALPAGLALNLWVLPLADPLLATIRQAGCRILPRKRTPSGDSWRVSATSPAGV